MMNDELKSPPKEMDHAGVNMPDAEDEVSPSLPRKGARGAKREESTIEDIMKLCDVVRERGFAIHRYHKHGHLEKVYENAQASAKALADEHVAQILGYLRSLSAAE
jgi:hypothetical protein